MSERFHPNMREDRVMVKRDSFVWQVNDFQALYEHLEDVATDVITGDTDAAMLKLRLLMCACTMAAERTHA